MTTEKEMSRIAAWRVVATVTNSHAVRDGTEMQLVTVSVSPNQALTVPDGSISAMLRSPRPPPTLLAVGSHNLGPKAVYKGCLRINPNVRRIPGDPPLVIVRRTIAESVGRSLATVDDTRLTHG